MKQQNLAVAYYSAWAQCNFLYAKWAAAHGVKYSELLVLYALSGAEGEGLTQTAIGERYGLPKQTVNSVVRGLRARGHAALHPCEEDRREKLVALTSEGQARAAALLAPLLAAEERVCGAIGPEAMRRMTGTAELFNLLFEKELGAQRGAL